MDYTFLLGSVENILGKSSRRARDNHAFHCPFCNHRKKKLEINFATNEKGENPWECWVCETKGRTIRSLLKQLRTPREQAAEVLKYLPKGSRTEYTPISILELPKEYQELNIASQTSVIANLVKKYLYDRGLNNNDFIKYGIVYCTAGEFGGWVILPSYSESNRLNYFVGRSYDGNFFKYKNPEVSKDIIFFENLINWNAPIILCEGVFDAIFAGNAVALLGSTLREESRLFQHIIRNDSSVFIALDPDAEKKAMKIAHTLLKYDIEVWKVDIPEGEDVSSIGKEAFAELNKSAVLMRDNQDWILKRKLMSL